MSQIHGSNHETDLPEKLKSRDGALFVADEIPLGNMFTKRIRFDAVADLPDDITDSAKVLADLVTLTNFPEGTTRFTVNFHALPLGYTGTTVAGPIASGVRFTVNAPDTTTAALRLTYTDLTGAGSATTYETDVFEVSFSCPSIEIELPIDDPLTRIDLIGVYAGLTPTNIIPAVATIVGLGAAT